MEICLSNIDCLLVYENKYRLQAYYDNCAYKILDKQMINCLDDSPFETNED